MARAGSSMSSPCEGKPPGHWLPPIYAGLLLLLGALHAGRPLVGYDDVWAHAAVGRWIRQHQQIPRQTLFLWTVHEPWVAHSWLSDVTFYGLLAADSTTDLVRAFTASLTVLTFALLWWFWQRRGRITSLTALLFLLAITAATARFNPRPDLFSSLFITLLLLFLIARTESPAAARVPRRYQGLLHGMAIVLLFMAWVNFHGAVVTGLLFLGITGACDLVQDRFDPRSRSLVLLGLLGGLAVCVNPYGLGYWEALRAVGGPMLSSLQEWKPFWLSPALPITVPISSAVLVVCALAAWLGGPSRRWSQLGWVLTAAALFLTARRHVYLLVIVCLAVMAANAGALDSECLWERLRRWLGRAGIPGGPPSMPAGLRQLAHVTVMLVAGVYLFLAYNYFSPPSEGRPYVPEGAARFVIDHALTGHAFNDYENSSYFQWRFGGQPSLFVDLLNAYPPQLLDDYHEILGLSPRGRQLLEELPIDLVVLTTVRHGRTLQPLVDYLEGNAGWVRVYFEADGAIWVRRKNQ